METHEKICLLEGAAPVEEKQEEHDVLRSLGFPAAPPGNGECDDYAKHESVLRRVRLRLTRLRLTRLRPTRLWRERARPRRWERIQHLVADTRGAVTAEYALVIVAAVAFAGLLIVIMRSDEVRAMLLSLVQNALGSAG